MKYRHTNVISLALCFADPAVLIMATYVVVRPLNIPHSSCRSCADGLHLVYRSPRNDTQAQVYLKG